MTIQFFITGKEKRASEVTTKSLQHLVESEKIMWAYIQEKDEAYIYPNQIKVLGGRTDFVCIIPNGSTVNSHIITIFKKYCEDKETIYLPLVVLTNEKAKGVLNSCLWNTNLAQEVGVLDDKLASKQIDTTLYGAFIPYAVLFDITNYNSELKYYQHFYFLNQVTQTKLVKGIPKTLLYTDIDLTFSHVEEQEKIEYFKMATKIKTLEIA